MNKLYIYFFLGLVALPLAGFSGGMITSEKVHAATKSGKKGSSATFMVGYGSSMIAQITQLLITAKYHHYEMMKGWVELD